MIKTIEKLINREVRLEQWVPSGLPNYIVYGRNFYRLETEGIPFIVVEIGAEDKADIRSLKSQVKKIADRSGCTVVLCFHVVKKVQIEALIRNNLPFIVPNEQVYMPFLGIALSLNQKKEDEKAQHKFKPSAQMLFLLLLYSEENCKLLKKDAAEILGLTRTSITRASQQLKELGLINEERNGQEVIISPVEQGYQYYMRAKEYLTSPVQRKAFFNADVNLKNCMIAGETALSEYSLLNAPRIVSYACDKKQAEPFQQDEIDSQWQSDGDLVQIEFWKYSPKLFAKDGIVDPVSLACSFFGNQDERIENEVEMMLEEYSW